MSPLIIKLEEAERVIAFPDFHNNDLLAIALTDPCTLNESGLSPAQQAQRKREYRRLAFLGDMLIDTILADFLYRTRQELTHEDFDNYRQDLADRPSLTYFAMELGLPELSSSWSRKSRKPPEEEPGVWGEMFEAVVGVLFLDADRDFDKVAQWLCDRFFRDVVTAYENEEDKEYALDDEDYDSTVITSEDYAEMMGLSRSDGVSFM